MSFLLNFTIGQKVDYNRYGWIDFQNIFLMWESIYGSCAKIVFNFAPTKSNSKTEVGDESVLGAPYMSVLTSTAFSCVESNSSKK